MNLVLHLFKKDLRRSYLLLDFWALLVAVQYAIMASSLNPTSHLALVNNGTISGVGPSLGSLVLAVLVALLVQEEPAAGTTAFWFTRPMSRSAVLRTKAIFAAILLALPVLAEAVVLKAGGVTPHDIALAVPEIILNELQVLLAAAVLAALTPNFARFAIAGAVSWVGLYLITLGGNWFENYLLRSGLEIARIGATLSQSRKIAHETLIAVGLGAAFMYQYLTRRTVRTLIFAILVETSAIAIDHIWTWVFFPPLPKPAATVALDLAAIKTTLQETRIQDVIGLSNSGLPKENVSGGVYLAGLPDGYVALATHVDPQLTAPDSHIIATQMPRQSITVSKQIRTCSKRPWENRLSTVSRGSTGTCRSA